MSHENTIPFRNHEIRMVNGYLTRLYDGVVRRDLLEGGGVHILVVWLDADEQRHTGWVPVQWWNGADVIGNAHTNPKIWP